MGETRMPLTRQPVAGTADWPREARRDQRRARLVSVGRELLKSDGVAQVTVTGVCAKAGLNDRYFYENFTNRAAFLEALFESATAERAARVFAQASLVGDVAARLRIMVDGTVQSILDDFHPDDLTSAGSGETLWRYRATLTKMAANVSAGYAETILGPGVGQSVDFQMSVLYVVAGAAELVIAWLAGTLDLSREQLVDKCARMINIALAGFVAEFTP
ncbi:TetR/AcrR family transcriptional regulator [Mycolicibacterium llatzerense]|uniref:TetR/AcrR family transcriptional regulator n=1 Tax=Mycolicibacterium llatzerense TaxID=280871 RepID=UPI0008DC9CDE|nr:TetR family transcriptional regulator [Mycolicibacterium llatzerense]